MDSISTQRIAPRPQIAENRPAPGQGAYVRERANEVLGNRTAAPEVGLKDRLLKMVNPQHLSPQEKQSQSNRISEAAERLRYKPNNQTWGQAAGMSLDEAKKLQSYAQSSGDANLKREADFLVRMLSDQRPSNDSPAPNAAPQGHRRYGSDAQCAASVLRANQGKSREEKLQQVYQGCG